RFLVAPIGGPLKGCSTIRLRGIHIGVLLDERAQGRSIAAHHSIRNIASPGRQAGAGNQQHHRTESGYAFQIHHRFSKRPVLSPMLSWWTSNLSRTLRSRFPVGTCFVGYAKWRLPFIFPFNFPTSTCGTS